MNNYTSEHSNNETKQLVRKEIVQDLIALKRVGLNKANRILTLPHLNFELETKALELGYLVNCVEKDKATFNQQKDIRTQMNPALLRPNGERGVGRLSLNRRLVSQFLRDNPNKMFDLCYLDFCSNVSKETDLVLTDLENRCSIVYLTVYLSREHEVHAYRFLSGNKIEDYKQMFAKLGYRTAEVFKYQNGTSPMATFKLIRDRSLRAIPRKKKIIEKIKKNCATKDIIINKVKGFFGSINPNVKVPLLLLSRRIVDLGFDINKKYEIKFNPVTNQIKLKESELDKAYKPFDHPRGSIQFQARVWTRKKMKSAMSIQSIEKKSDTTWILQLEDK